MFGGNPELAQKVREICLTIEEETDENPRFTKGTFIKREFDCYEKCAYGKDNCAPGLGGYHGYGSRRLTWFVQIPGKGGVGFDLLTPIYLPETVVRMQNSPHVYEWTPLGTVDLHLLHPKEPQWMTQIDGGCLVSGGNYCYCDGTSLEADTGVEVLLKGGSQGVWSWLAEAWLPDVIRRSE